MKKTAAVVAGMMAAAGIALAGGWLAPVFSTQAISPSATHSLVYTNTTGNRVDIQSIWMTGTYLTNGSMTVAQSATTNALPVTVNGTTIYTAPGGVLTLEKGGILTITGLMSSTDCVTTVSIYTTVR